jgi:hypothetical protein
MAECAIVPSGTHSIAKKRWKIIIGNHEFCGIFEGGYRT